MTETMTETTENRPDWENEGGSLLHDDAALPDGITSHVVYEFRVGPYRYTDLDHARAELARQQGKVSTAGTGR